MVVVRQDRIHRYSGDHSPPQVERVNTDADCSDSAFPLQFEERLDTLGKRLLRVSRLMQRGDEIPIVGPSAPFPEVVAMISSRRLGMTCVMRPDGTLAGVITDGDLRRRLSDPSALIRQTAETLMTNSPHTIAESMLAVEALNLMETKRVTSLVVVDDDRIRGVVHLHDLWRTELF